MDPKIKVEFRITGTKITAEEITNFLGISPTSTWNLGDSIQGTKIRRKHNGWCISIGNIENSLDLMDYIEPLIKFLLPKSELIAEFCSGNGLYCEIACTIYIIDQTPIINFSPILFSNLAELKTNLDIDLILTE
jgi:hypothetical protein